MNGYFLLGLLIGSIPTLVTTWFLMRRMNATSYQTEAMRNETIKNELAKASSKRESVAETIPPSDPSKPAMPAEWLALAEDVFRRNEAENAATIAGKNPFKQAAPEAIKSRDMRNLGYTLSAYRYNGRLPGPKDTPTP